MLKSFNELYALDLSGYTEIREENGKYFSYLPWNKALVLLHEHGAERVEFVPLYNKDGHSVFVLEDGKGLPSDGGKRAHDPMAPEVHVRVVIDDCVGEFSYPLINGKEVITMGKMNQQLVNSARQRAFVKGVAIMTGLGLSLWEKEDSEPKSNGDIYMHDAGKLHQRIGEAYAKAMSKVGDERELERRTGYKAKLYGNLFQYLEKARDMEEALRHL